MNFKQYQHVERFGSTEVEGIEKGVCYIFPKLDGTNASIWFDNKQVQAGSRKRQLTIEKDNAGFCQWVQNNRQRLTHFFEHISKQELRLFGEWLVPHTIKEYKHSAWRKFYVFDVYSDVEKRYLTFEEYEPLMITFNLDYLQPIAIVQNPSHQTLTAATNNNHVLMKPGVVGEGVVIKNYKYINRYGRITWAKIVRDEYKQCRGKRKNKNKIPRNGLEKLICSSYVTPHLVNKIEAKITNEMNGWSSKLISRLLQTVFYDLVNEEMWNILKKFKNPTINFRCLQAETNKKIKELNPELF